MNSTIALDRARAKGRGWRIALGLLLALGLLVALGAFEAIDRLEPGLVQISIDGAPLVTDLDLAGLPPAHKVVLAIGLAVAVLVALFVAMGGVAVALIAVVPVLLLAVALPLLVLSAVLLMLLSPLLLLGWLLWRAVRPARRSTTMAA